MWSHKLGLQITARSFPRNLIISSRTCACSRADLHPRTRTCSRMPSLSFLNKGKKSWSSIFRCHLRCHPQTESFWEGTMRGLTHREFPTILLQADHANIKKVQAVTRTNSPNHLSDVFLQIMQSYQTERPEAWLFVTMKVLPIQLRELFGFPIQAHASMGLPSTYWQKSKL